MFYYRPPDAAASFNKTSSLRFSAKSPCDCFIFDGSILYALELKSTKATSMSFERKKEDKAMIHKHQIDYLESACSYHNVVPGFVLDFRKSEKTYFCYIEDFISMTESIAKKSFNEKDLLKYAHPIEIEKRKLMVNYRYNVTKLFADIKARMN